MTQIPSDKLKMIDSESKMETAPQGERESVSTCSRTQVHLLSACMCMHERCTKTSGAILSSCMQCCCWSEPVSTVRWLVWVYIFRTEGWAYYIGFLTLLRMWEDGRYPMCEPQSDQHACNALSCVSCQHQLKAWNSGLNSVKIHQEHGVSCEYLHKHYYIQQHTMCRFN